MWPAVKVMGLNRDNAVNQPAKSPTVRESQIATRFAIRTTTAHCGTYRAGFARGWVLRTGRGPRAGLYFATPLKFGRSKNLRLTIPCTERLRILSRHQMSGPPRRVRPHCLTWRPAAPPVVSDGACRNAGGARLMKSYARATARDHHTVSQIYFFSSRHFLPLLSVANHARLFACTQRSPPV